MRLRNVDTLHAATSSARARFTCSQGRMATPSMPRCCYQTQAPHFRNLESRNPSLSCMRIGHPRPRPRSLPVRPGHYQMPGCVLFSRHQPSWDDVLDTSSSWEAVVLGTIVMQRLCATQVQRLRATHMWARTRRSCSRRRGRSLRCQSWARRSTHRVAGRHARHTKQRDLSAEHLRLHASKPAYRPQRPQFSRRETITQCHTALRPAFETPLLQQALLASLLLQWLMLTGI